MAGHVTPSDSAQLKSRAEALGIELSDAQSEQCRHYVQILWHANRQVNLTRHTTWHLFVARDLMDSWQLSKLLPEGCDVLDIGSGAGVPGILLAILRPDLQVSLCESVAKKANFLKSTVEQMDLSVPVFHDRAEKVLDDLSFDFCTARAVGPIWKLCTWLSGHWLHARRLLAIKGPNWESEMEEARKKQLTQSILSTVVSEYEVSLADPDANEQDVNEKNLMAKSFILQVRAKNAP